MTELKATGLVAMTDVNPLTYNSEKQIVLKPDFNWFLSEDFTSLLDIQIWKEKALPSTTQQNNHSEKNDDILGGEISFKLHNNLEDFSCYYCNYRSANEEDYKRHNVYKHPGRPAFPNKAEIEKRGLKPQGKP